MGDVYERASFRGAEIADHVDATVRGAAHFAINVQDSLDGIRDNTKRLFWWTSTLVYVCIGLFVLAQLVRLRHELHAITQYQELFMRMWDEDRRMERARIEEEKRERQVEERNRRARAAAKYGRGGMAAPTGGRGIAPGIATQHGGAFSSGVDADFGSVSPPGPAGTKGGSPTYFSSGYNNARMFTQPRPV
ncbi:hypothetical protein F4818DRAFT_451464 [Hypoxylon cercidicola]|nr:hypothetical protein F4818DRAFT_451464 [Hypoxylon cercidicola]